VTAVQMLAAYNTVANRGVYVAPKLVKATVGADGKAHDTPPSARRRVVSERTADVMTAMLGEVVRVGTGKLAAIDGYSVAGKTGRPRPRGPSPGSPEERHPPRRPRSPDIMRLDRVVAGLDVLAMPAAAGAAAVDVRAVAYDSRAVTGGALFCCVPGEHVDGHD